MIYDVPEDYPGICPTLTRTRCNGIIAKFQAKTKILGSISRELLRNYAYERISSSKEAAFLDACLRLNIKISSFKSQSLISHEFNFSFYVLLNLTFIIYRIIKVGKRLG